MEEGFVRKALGIDAEKLTHGMIFKKRKEWAKALKEREEELRKYLELPNSKK